MSEACVMHHILALRIFVANITSMDRAQAANYMFLCRFIYDENIMVSTLSVHGQTFNQSHLFSLNHQLCRVVVGHIMVYLEVRGILEHMTSL